jgi:hypothetical protein
MEEKMEQHLLITLNRDWADEFNVEGMVVLSASEWEAHKKLAQDYFEEKGSAEVYFGTNEFLEYSSYNEYIKEFKITELNKKQFDVLKELFTIKGYSWEHPKGKMNVVPDRIHFGIIPMIKSED